MLIIGLTGSIGMGKSTTANFFRQAGVPVHDADQAVHELYQGIAVPLIGQAFPNAVENGKVNRDKLFSNIVNDAPAMKRLEAIIHPLVREHRHAFLAQCGNIKTMVFDVPLLFETGTDKDCDVIITVSAPFNVQKNRVLARDGMTEARFMAIVEKQLPDNVKRQRSHFVIESGRGFASAQRQVQDVLRCLAPVMKVL